MFYPQHNHASARRSGNSCGMSTLSIECPHPGVDKPPRVNRFLTASSCGFHRESRGVHTVHPPARLSQTWACAGMCAREGVVSLGGGQYGHENTTPELGRSERSSEAFAVQGIGNPSVDSVDRARNQGRITGGAVHV